MVHGGYDKRRVARRKPGNHHHHHHHNNKASHKSKTNGGVGGVHKSKIDKKPKSASLKNQIRSTQRFLQRELPVEVRAAQEKKLEELKKEQDEHNRLAVERKIFLRDKKIKFFERRKIERRMRRLEKQQRASSDQTEDKSIMEELAKLKEDLEYVRFFPKAEKYVPLFCGDDKTEVVDSRKQLRTRIKENIAVAAASGKDLEETGSDDDGLIDITDDDFFVSGSSSDEADADDELTDINAREQASNAFNKTASAIPNNQRNKLPGISNDQRNKRQKSAMALMPPPRPQKSSTERFDYGKSRNVSNNRRISHSSDGGASTSQAGQSSNISSNSDAPKRRRKRRPKKKNE